MLVRVCDALHRECEVDHEPWTSLKTRSRDEALMERVMLAGYLPDSQLLDERFLHADGAGDGALPSLSAPDYSSDRHWPDSAYRPRE